VSHPLEEAYAKVERAGQYIQQLHEHNVAWVAAHPYNIVAEVDQDSGRRIGVARAQGPEEAVPMYFGLVAGDFAHNLRSALNYLAWQLALRPVGTGPGRDTQFPIFFDRDGHTYKTPARERFLASAPRFMHGIQPEHQARIERYQPYHGGYRKDLAFLASINDIDKHRVVPTTEMSANLRPLTIRNSHDGTLVQFLPNPRIHDGAVIWRELDAFPPRPDVEVEVDSSYAIGFGEPDLTGHVGVMMDTVAIVRAILRCFRDVFR